VAAPTGTAYTNIGLANGTNYYYVVSATNYVAESGNSSEATATPLAPPAAPTGLTASAGDSQVSLSWNPASGAANYNLKRSTVTGGPYIIIATPAGTNYTNLGLTNDTIYYYVVSSTNALFESSNSSEASATPVAGPITLILGPQTNGQFTFQFQGVDGRDYVVQTSTNLADWTPILTNQQTGGLFIYTDTNATDAVRFYRVQQ
jgi:hypothetical protein